LGKALGMTQILCIGSVLWDIVGRTPRQMRAGADVAGRIRRIPGGVALNVAMALRRFGLTPGLLSVIGTDPEGDELVAAARARGLDLSYICRETGLPTDRYMAIEGANGLMAAIADAHSLEEAGDRILSPLEDGRLGSAARPFAGTIVLDGNLTSEVLDGIAGSPCFTAADIRLAPASPGKAERLRGLLNHPNITLYVNKEEAGILTHTDPKTARDAAMSLSVAGVRRICVTDGAQPACFAADRDVITQTPPAVPVARVTGAGDMFMAAHIAAEQAGLPPEQALDRALLGAADYISNEAPL